jgi:hypothetical protein
MAPPGDDHRSALPPSSVKPATWFEFVDDTELIAFRQPLLTAFSRPVAIGELVGGPRNGTLVVIPIRPAGDSPEGRRMTAGEVDDRLEPGGRTSG